MPKIRTPVAIVLIAVGIAGFAYQGIRLMTGEIDPHHLPLPPVIGVLALIVGIALLLMDGKDFRPGTREHDGPGPRRGNPHGRSS